jgi:hypothetical protein
MQWYFEIHGRNVPTAPLGWNTSRITCTKISSGEFPQATTNKRRTMFIFKVPVPTETYGLTASTSISALALEKTERYPAESQ